MIEIKVTKNSKELIFFSDVKEVNSNILFYHFKKLTKG